ncbi:hypothetical protein ACF1FC_34025 [Streptomyces sp. NPDC014344]|uniref:hypothetical protein n=1 Tax=Streptomyces sp. NPDC014344 TaxID=3364871 RepID=UPI0036FAE7F7
MGDFEIYLSFSKVDGERSTRDLPEKVAHDVAKAINADPPVADREMWQVRSGEAAAIVMLLPPGGEHVWPVLESHPYLVQTFFVTPGQFSGSFEMAMHVFDYLNRLDKYQLLLVHDVEEYVVANFTFTEREQMSVYRTS